MKSNWDPKISKCFLVVDVLPVYTKVVWLAYALSFEAFSQACIYHLILKKKALGGIY